MVQLGQYRQRIYASLLILGAAILLFRTVTMVAEGAFNTLEVWVNILLIIEMLVDLGFVLAAIPWWISNHPKNNLLPFKIGVAVVVVHAIRVLVFVLGRTGPWFDFDVKPEHRALHASRWTWSEVYFASTMVIVSVIVLIIFWQYRRILQKKTRRR